MPARFHLRRAALLLLLAGAAGPPVHAARPRDLLREGHERMQDGHLAEALARYQEAAQAAEGTALDPAVALYNAARALAALGRHEEAAATYRRALESGFADIQVPARYNKANARLRAVQALAEQDPQQARQALPDLEEALDAYRDAMLLDPADEDLKANFELARRLKQAIEELPPPPPQPENDDEEEDDQDEPPSPPPPTPPENGNDDPEEPPENGDEPEAPETGDEPTELATPPPDPPQLTPEDAERILDAQRQEEEAYREQVRLHQFPPERVEKDW